MASPHRPEVAVVNPMPEGRIWTADELLAMTPNERHEVVPAGIVTDLGQAPAHLLEESRVDIRGHISDSEAFDVDG